MNVTPQQELLSFAARVIERHGGIVERGIVELEALLPESLAGTLELSEEVTLGNGGEPLLYGLPLLDRLLCLATRQVPVVYGKLQVPYLKKEGFERLLSRDLTIHNAETHILSRAEARSSYMILACHYVALSDERREGLVHLAMHEGSGALIPTLQDSWTEYHPAFFPHDKVPAHYPTQLDQAVNAGLKHARELVAAELDTFVSSMRRHLQRDVRNTREYYQALKKEMEVTLASPRLSDEHREDRKRKIQDLPREVERKVEDLQHKYQIEVKLTPRGAIRLLIPVVQLLVQIRHRHQKRNVPLNYNPTTQRLDPLVCEQCHATVESVHPSLNDSAMRLWCGSCCTKR